MHEDDGCSPFAGRKPAAQRESVRRSEDDVLEIGPGPGFTTDVLASTIFKQYQAGFYGLSTAGNVVLFILVSALVFPLNWFLRRRELTS